MNRLFPLFFLVGALSLTSCEKEKQNTQIPEAFTQPYKANHSKSTEIQKIIDQYTKKGVPGVVVSIKDSEGVWEGSSGYANIESNRGLPTGYVYPAASITKTYMATAFAKMNEDGIIRLNSPVVKYLPASLVQRLDRAQEITVRMLLNHTSGLRDYIADLDFKLYRFNHLSHGWTVDRALSYGLDHSLLFKPGTGYAYSNTNYLLLSRMLEHTTGMAEGAWLQKFILAPSDLNHTFYSPQSPFLKQLPMPDFYLDRFGSGRLENVTKASKNEIESELGDGGLVATSIDFVNFLDALMQGKIVSRESLSQMKQFGAESEYGLGLETGYNYNDQTQYGHQGAVYGGFSLLLYFEKQQTSFFLSINTDATLVGGKTLVLCHEMKNEIARYLSTF